MTKTVAPKLCCVNDLGLIEYSEAYACQKRCLNKVIDGGEQTLIFCEHPTVLTMGRLADQRNRLITDEDLKELGVSVHPVDRGGDITLHAPGQLVVYPIFQLAHSGKDLRRYLYQLEQVAIDLLGDFGIVASRISGKTGVWVGANKIASIGIGVRKWVSYHGLAINVNTDLDLFKMIRPCGLDVRMTSMAEIRGQAIKMEDVKKGMAGHFAGYFNLDLSWNL